jgi:hypothetical protein
MALVSFIPPFNGRWLIDCLLPGVVQLDPWLSPFKDALKHRFSKAQQWIKTIDETEGGLEKFSRVGTTQTIPMPKLTFAGQREVWIQCG